ncbi:hypothetical protein BDF21DRAFT_448024 [Thamnidium elegans]|nr:hypothetical protein BDF21DRAFT_448024 [Thamnidium elegans]
MSSPPPKHSLSSPTSGNTPHPVLPTPSSSTSVSIRQNNKTSQLRQELEQQLVEKQKQLQESSSGIGKNVLARQVSQLQDRIKEIDSSSTDEVQPISVDRLRSLERDPASYRSHPLSPGMSSMRNKEKLLNTRSAAGLDPLPSPSASTLLPPTHGHDSTSLLPLPPPPTGSTPTKRRSKIPNTDRRNTDIEFATEIGQGLLLEVRKMQALLQEKEEKLRTLENQKADLERAAEAMAKQMRQREENEEKLKEETWNLELAKQELTISVTELQQNLSKANVEQNKLAKQVNTLRTEIEQLRDKEEKLTHSIDNMKQRHEQDMSSIRRHAAAIQREKTDQSKQIEALTSELAIAKAQSRIHKHVVSEPEPTTHSSEATDDQTTSVLAVKNDTSPSSSPPSSPKQTPTRNQAMEVETLKTSLAHAHRMVSNLRSNLHKEKTEKFEFKKLLADSQETIEQLQNDPRMWVDAGPARGNSTSNVFSREDGLPSRRSHKASTSSTTRRRVKKNSTAGRSKLKPPHLGPVGDDSVYSYASMSEDSEDVDSFEESDAGFENVSSKKKHMFTPLSSELSQSQLQDHKPIMIDAQVNTEPLDDFMLPTSVLENSQVESPQVTGSLGDELGRAMSQKSPKGDEMSLNHMAGGLIAGAGAALGIEALKKKAGIEISTQTESQLEVHEISIQTEPLSLQEEATATISVAPTIIKLDMVSQPSMNVEPEDPTIALAATAAAIAAAIAASRSEALEAAVDCSTQFDSEIALADTEALIAESRTKALEAAVDGSTQFDSEIALADTEALIAASRAKALESAVDGSTQFDAKILLAETEALIAASRAKALESAVETSTQCDEPVEDPSIALAAAEASAAATAAAVAAGIEEYRANALASSVDCAIQSEPEDLSIALAATAAAISAARAEALESSIDCSTQYDEPVEDPSIALAAAEASAAATAAAVAAGIAESRSKALEAAVDTSTQSEEFEEDPSIAEAIAAATATATAAAVAAGIAEYRSKALESAVETYTQCDEIFEDPSVAIAAAEASSVATAAAVAAGIAEYRSKVLESAVNASTQSEEPVEDPSIALDAAAAAAAATAAAVAVGIAESRSKSLELAIDTSTQSEVEDASIFEAKVSAAAAALRAASLEEAINTSTQCDPEDPSIAASAIASAIAASRTASLEAAVDTCTQSDEIKEDPSVAIAAAEAAAVATASAIAASRLASIEAAIDTFTQFEGPSVIDQETQIEYVESVDSGVQSISVDAVDAFIQSEGVETKDSDAQYECTTLVDQETQYDISGVDNSTQSNVAETSECGIQSDEPSTLDAYAQHQIESNDIGVQCEEITQGSTIIPIPLPPVSSRTFSESEDEFFDANSKPSSRRTIDSTMFNNAKPASRSKEIKLMPGSFESELNASEREGVSNNREMMAIGAATAATLANNALTKDNKDASLVDHDFDTLNGPISSETNHDDEFTDKSTTLAALDNYDHIASDDKDNVQGFNNAAPSKDDVQELGNVSPKEKMFSKSETDSLIATAVALALANAFKNKKDNVNSDLLEDRKRHTCDMSLNNNNADSESGMRDIDDQHNNDGDYGNVLVHCPREEDIITSLPYDENAQRRRDRSGLPIIDTSRLDTSSLDTRPLESFKNLEPLQKEIKQERPELTVGPSLVFAQEPEEPEECEITAADVPQRPSNPPPRELLNKASLSSTFTEARSMSPISVRSKGKQPMEYSDLESLSPRSHDDLQRSAVLQQQQQSNLGSKRGSISVSSVSTNNTNEQLRSINSSQYDAVTRSTGTTDPTVINLITQTMIGDWLYKYTRKAVGGGLSERRHQRYFWIHPYTRTLYWSTAAPGVNGNETKAKSALIENITSVPDYSNATDGTPNQSLLIQTSHRQIKLTAPTMEKHELWLEAITHLLARDGSGKGLALLNDTKKSENPNNRSVSSGSGSLLNRPSFRRLHDIFQHPSSAPSMVTSDDHTDLDYDDDEALEDVRMCCNGKHHVSKLEKDHNHRHQYRKRKSRATITTT